MIVLAALLGIGFLVGISILMAVCIYANKAYAPQQTDCIVVLGARIWPQGNMSHTLIYRCESALKAWQAGQAPTIIACGGRGSDEPIAEAEAMRAWFIKNGVPENRIFTDTASKDTRENLKNARAIMTEHGFESAAVCTSDYHLKRSLWIARDVGVQACGISSSSPKRPTTYVLSRLRETVSWVLYFLK